MKGYKGKLGVLLVVLIVALGSLGTGYALWTGSLYMDGTVGIGTENLGFSGDWQFTPDAGDITTTCNCTFSDSDFDGDDETMQAEITVTGDSLSGTHSLSGEIKNTGTLPVKIDSVVFTYASPFTSIVESAPGVAGTILDPNDTITLDLEIEIDAPAAGSWSFDVQLVTSPWNS